MKYSETQGKPLTNWFSELDIKIKDKNAGTPHWKLLELSKDWVTCACGNQCDILPRYSHGMPIDIDLSDLGMDFYYAVRDGEWKEAIQILQRIERRSWHLITSVYNYQPMILAPLL